MGLKGESVEDLTRVKVTEKGEVEEEKTEERKRIWRRE